jgi:hypothetical protein
MLAASKPNQLHQFGEATALQAASVHGDQAEPSGHQFGFEAIRHAQPAHLPVPYQGLLPPPGLETKCPPVPLAAISSRVMAADVPVLRP